MSITRSLKHNVSPGVITPQIQLFGDWEKTKYLFSTIDATLLVAVEMGKKSAAEKIKAAVRKNIRENGGSLNWPPVSAKYAKYKSKKGYDPNNLLYMTGLYYRSIAIWKKGLNYYVGVKRNTQHPNRDITVGQIAQILESGSYTQGIAARPLWGPTFRQIGGNARIRGLILWHIRNEIFKKYNIRPKISI